MKSNSSSKHLQLIKDQDGTFVVTGDGGETPEGDILFALYVATNMT